VKSSTRPFAGQCKLADGHERLLAADNICDDRAENTKSIDVSDETNNPASRNSISMNARRAPNRIPKGVRSGEKAHSPDPYDGYRFEELSPVF
jgi:hypothetical protein